jgi:uracil-DNA glycosylase family 4
MPSPPSDLFFGTSGPRDAEIAVVAESWGNSEAYAKAPLVGQSGEEFNRILLEAGIDRRKVFCTNVFAAQPQGNETWRFFDPAARQPTWKGLHPSPWAKQEVNRLYEQLRVVKPKIVLAVGNYSLWALSEGLVSFGRQPNSNGASVLVPAGITSWRGSMLTSQCITGLPDLKILPLIHPASILRQWSQRAVTVHDLRTRVPLALRGDWRPSSPPTIYAPPSFEDATRVLQNWYIHAATGSVLRLSNDIETSRGNISCVGFADGPYEAGSTALVIPLVRPTPDQPFGSYWTKEEEYTLTRLMIKLLVHPNVRIEGQNYNYDTQWFSYFWKIVPRLDFDTMLAHHLLWPGTTKGLDYLSSLYCKYHWYWKDDNKDWDLKGDFTRHLIYNGEDCLRTFECATSLRQQIKDQGFEALWEIEKEKNDLALEMMTRGIKIDKGRRSMMAFELQAERQRIYEWLSNIIPQSVVAPYVGKTSKSQWWASPDQQKTLFYELLGLSGQRNRKTGRPTMDAEALETLKMKNPEYSRIWDALTMSRSISVFHNTFISAELDFDGRMRCSFNTAGTETFRWSSSENAFGRGTNLQNIPKGEEE